LDKSKDDAWSEKLEIEAKVSILQDEKRLLGERCISAESQIDEQKNRIRSLVSQCESLQCALEELGRENQTLQVKLVTN
jgi:chromosome segregation ATPase